MWAGRGAALRGPLEGCRGGDPTERQAGAEPAVLEPRVEISTPLRSLPCPPPIPLPSLQSGARPAVQPGSWGSVSRLARFLGGPAETDGDPVSTGK